MSKLITPVRYEPALDELNIGKRLNIPDKVRSVLPVPILNSNPVSENRPPAGKLLRCNNQGSILTQNPSVFTRYQKMSSIVYFGATTSTLFFNQKVYELLIEFTDSNGTYDYYLCDDSYTLHFFKLPEVGMTRVLMKGAAFYFVGQGGGAWEVEFSVYGFY